eukprot:9882036-Alexandrium_andersonii.AAC.1
MPYLLIQPVGNGALRLRFGDDRFRVQFPHPLPGWLLSRLASAGMNPEALQGPYLRDVPATSLPLLVEWEPGPLYQDIITPGWGEEADLQQQMLGGAAD